MSKSIADLQALVRQQSQAIDQLKDLASQESEIRNQRDLEAMGIDALTSSIDQALTQEIRDALKSRYPRARLQQVGKAHGIRWETLEGMANSIAGQTLGVDLETVEFSTMVDQVKYLEEQIEDCGLRSWKLQSLARKYGRSCSQLMEAFSKALVNNAPVQPKTLRQLKEENGGEIEWLFPGWVIRGTTILLHALGGTGKTLFAYDMANALIKGIPWQGYPTQKRKVLIVQLDEPPQATIERLEIRGIPQDEVEVLGNWQAEELPRLAAYIETERPDFVIVDSLTAINRNCCFKENDVEYARPLLHLADLASRTDTTFLIIHHSSVDGRARGSTAIHNSVSEVWGLSHHNEALNERKLKVEKTRLGRPPGSYKFTFHPENYSFEYDGELQGDVLREDDTPQQEKIRLWLSEDDHRCTPYTPREIAEALQLNDASCRRACREACSRKLISRKRATKGQGYVYYVGALQYPLGCRSSDSEPTVTKEAIGGGEVDHPPIASRSAAEKQTGHRTGQISDRVIGIPAKSEQLRMNTYPDRPIANPSNPIEPQDQSYRSGKRSGSDRAAIAPPLDDKTGSVNENPTVTSNFTKRADLEQPKVGDRVVLGGGSREGYMHGKNSKPLTRDDLKAQWTLRKVGRMLAEITRAAGGTTQIRRIPKEWVFLQVSAAHADQL